MNRHSRLEGNAADSADAQHVRGQRAFCSDRGQRGGCGRTFPVFLASTLPRHSVTSAVATRLLVSMLAGAALQTAAEALRAPFAMETFYRLRQRLRLQLGRVRVCLCAEQPPPPCAHADPLLQTVAHLQSVFAGDLVAAFQLRFQQPFFA